jgi:hypothetical protein
MFHLHNFIVSHGSLLELQESSLPITGKQLTREIFSDLYVFDYKGLLAIVG